MLLKLKYDIEEARLIYGKKIELFLLKNLKKFGDFLSKVFSAKFAAFFSFLVIFAISLLVQFSRDIGHDSGAYLDITEKLLNGGKYYQNFFETNFPLPFCITAIPVFLAKFFGFSPIVFSQIFVNLVGILAIYSSAKILNRSNISEQKTIYNLVVISLAIGFFLRVFTLHFNEMLTKSTYFLAFAIPYISYQLISDSKLKISDQLIIGTLAAVLFCLKPHYGILVVVFEVTKLLKSKSIKSAFCLRNYVTLFWILSYIAFLFRFFPDFIEAIPHLYESYYRFRDGVVEQSIFLIIREDLFPIFLLNFLCFFLIKKHKFLWTLFLTSVALGLIVILEIIAGYDQRFSFYSLSLPLVSSLMILVFRGNYINWRRDGFIVVIIFGTLQFDPKVFAQVIFNIGVFWWIVTLAMSKKWREILGKNISKSSNLFTSFLLPYNWQSWLYFLVMMLATLVISSHRKYANIAWLFTAIILISLIFLYQKLHEKTQTKKEFSTFSAIAISVIFSYFLSLHLAAIFNFSSSKAHIYKSPNRSNDQIVKIIKLNTSDRDEIAVISKSISATYPVSNYVKKSNSLPSLQLSDLYLKIADSRPMSIAEKHLFSKLKQQINRKENKLIFVDSKNHSRKACLIGFLEYYFRDAEFRKIFNQNYVFLNQVRKFKKSEKSVSFFDEKNHFELPNSTENILEETEIYVRKND